MSAAPHAGDPYALLRRKLARAAPLTDLDATLARGDLQVLNVWDRGQVRGIAVVERNSPVLRLQLYYADDPRVARELMNLLNLWVAEGVDADVMVAA